MSGATGATGATGDAISDVIARRTLAPNGVLRVAINVGNSVLAQRADAGGVQGISVDLATKLAERLQVRVAIQVYDAAGKVVEALKADEWDLAFLAIDPKRSEEIAFTPAYVVIEGAYMVREAAPYHSSADVDGNKVRIAVGAGSAYELFLSRNLSHARIEKSATGAEAFNAFVNQELEALAGVRQVVERLAAEHAGYRVLNDSFMSIHQALAVPKRSIAALPYLTTFIEEMKAAGEIAAALARSGQSAAAVAPAADAATDTASKLQR